LLVSAVRAELDLAAMWKDEEQIIGKGEVIHRNERNGAPLLMLPSDVAAKLFPYKGALKHLLRVFSKSTKAHKQWRSAKRLHELGLNTPRPLGVEVFRFGGEYEAVYMYQYLRDAIPFHEALALGSRSDILGKLAHELSKMAHKDMLFIDFHLGNVLVDTNGELWWIDPEVLISKKVARKKFWSRLDRMYFKCDVGVLTEDEWKMLVELLSCLLPEQYPRYSDVSHEN